METLCIDCLNNLYYDKITIIISAFPATGKSYFTKNNNMNLSCKDSDSSFYSWVDINGKKERNPNFPDNYIQAIKDDLGKFDIIFVSSHEVVRQALKNNNLPFILVFPFSHNKVEYLERYKKRGDNQDFINLMDYNFVAFIQSILNDNSSKKYVLLEKETITDIIPKILYDVGLNTNEKNI